MIPGLPFGQLEKMTIQSFLDPEFSRDRKELKVMFNPTQYSRKHEIVSQDRSAPGVQGEAQQSSHTPAEEMTFEFLFDGTGATQPLVPGGVGVALPGVKQLQEKLEEGVESMVKYFLDLAFYKDGESHTARFLILNWGILHFRCKLSSAEVQYTLFKADGQPLRAKINATFVEHRPVDELESKERSRSPDLTRYHEVAEGDTIYNLTDKVYEDSTYYLQLARVNELNHFRRLRTGSNLRMPPVRNSTENNANS